MPYKFNNNYRRGDNYRVEKKSKRSGAKFGYAHGEQARPYVRGWNFSKSRGMISVICAPYKKTDQHKSKSGRTWFNWFAKVTLHRTMQVVKTSAMYSPEKKQVYLPEFNMILSPNSPNGGYFGRLSGRR